MRLTILGTIVALMFATGCAKKPPNLSPQAELAFSNGRVMQALDTVRDVATVWNAYGIAGFTTPITRRIVQFHSSALTVMDRREAGWQQVVQTSLTELTKNLSPEQSQQIAPYAALVSVLLNSIGTREIDEVVSAQVIAAYQARLSASLATDRNWLSSHP